jgi:hypothetical protein
MQCAFVGAEGRCPEREGLQLDHAEPHALGGRDDAANLRAYCAPHNYQAAERIFGVEFMRARREANRSRSGTDVHSRFGSDAYFRSKNDGDSRSGTDVNSRFGTDEAGAELIDRVPPEDARRDQSVWQRKGT